MPEYSLSYVPVHFPYDAYDCQKEYMDKVIKSLQNRQHALLESPTGTGKTLCLLCSTLAWISSFKRLKQFYMRNSYREAQEKAGLVSELEQAAFGSSKEDVINSTQPKIIYVSRTHSQLSQVVKEFLNTSYRDQIKMCVLGSREQMCIEQTVRNLKSSAAQTNACRKAVQSQRCQAYHNIQSVKHMPRYKTMDIEDLVKFGTSYNACPYYLSRENQNDADIIFMPYNYLVDATSRQAQNINVENAILIFDEAHNVESFCSDAASFEMNSIDVTECLDEVDKCKGYLASDTYFEGRDLMDAGDLDILRAILVRFEKAIQGIDIPSSNELVFPGEYIFQLYETVGISFENYGDLVKIGETVAMTILTLGGSHKNGKSAMTTWLKALKTVFDGDAQSNTDDFSSNYKVYLKLEQQKHKAGRITFASSGPDTRTLSFWCFNSGVTMKALISQGCRSIILTSGTLSPLDSFASEMQIAFSQRLENPHVIKEDQLFVGVLARGPSGTQLNSSYQNREHKSYQIELGNALVNFCRVVPDGILVFFPSYHVMDMCIKGWQEKHPTAKPVWDRIRQYKEPFVEPKDKKEFADGINEFYSKINKESTGAIFFAVCRGKASEGIDFSDTRGRAVVITGIPYPALNDPRVKLKRQFLNDRLALKNKGKLKAEEGVSHISGDVWYTQQAARAVNQAIGRVIRHRNDWGAVLLCDDRFSQPNTKAQLPKWVRPFVQDFDSFGKGVAKLTQFVRHRIQVEALTTPAEPVKEEPVEQQAMTENKPVAANSLFLDAFKRKPTQIEYEIPTLGHLTANTALTNDAYVSEKLTSFPIGTSKPLSNLRSMTSKTVQESKQYQNISNKVASIAPTAAFRKVEQISAEQKDKKLAARSFLDETKNSLSREEYKLFQRKIADFKAKVIGFAEFSAELEKIFATPDRFHLMQYIVMFIPSKHKETYQARCVEIEERLKHSLTKTRDLEHENKRPRIASPEKSASGKTQ